MQQTLPFRRETRFAIGFIEQYKVDVGFSSPSYSFTKVQTLGQLNGLIHMSSCHKFITTVAVFKIFPKN